MNYRAVLETKKINLMEKQLEFEKIKLNMQSRKEVFDTFTDKVFELQKLGITDLKYGPKILSDFGNVCMGILNGGEESGETTIAESKSSADLSDLDERVELALSQGMRWNASNAKPERRSTIIRKLEEWESALSKGREVDPETVVGMGYEEVLSAGDNIQSYVLGICEKVEESLGIGCTSVYLKTRFRRSMEKYVKAKGLGVSGSTAPQYDLDELGGKLVTRFLGDGVEKSNFNRRVDVFKKYVEAVDMRWEDVSGVDILMRMVNGHMPIGIPLTKSSDNPTIPEVFQQIVIRKIYNDELEKFWKDFCKDEGLIC